MALPEIITTTNQLDDILSTPSSALINTLAAIDGDIMVLGAGGKMGPTLTRMAHRAAKTSAQNKTVYAVARSPLPDLEKLGITTLNCDLLDLDALNNLPRVKNIIFMAGRKFGSQSSEWLTWAANAMIPHNVAKTFTDSRIVAFSTGCVYPLVHVESGGSVETDSPEPVGEYAMSCLARERIFDYYSHEQNMPLTHIRLNYAVELRYGVLIDIAQKVFNNQPVDITTPYFNAIWQGDACDQILRSLAHTSSPPTIFNITGPQILAVRDIADRFAERFAKPVTFTGTPTDTGYLSNAQKALKLFGPPTVSIDQAVLWIAHWLQNKGQTHNKPTHFEVQDGKY